MSTANPGMDADVFEQFIEQLQRYVRERLVPAEKQILETDLIPDDIMKEMRDMGLFGLTMPEEFGGAGMNIQQYTRTIRELSYAMPCYRSITSINRSDSRRVRTIGSRFRMRTRISRVLVNSASD